MGESESFTVIDSIYIQYYWSCRVLGLDLEVGIVKRRFHFYYIGKTLDKQHIYMYCNLLATLELLGNLPVRFSLLALEVSCLPQTTFSERVA